MGALMGVLGIIAVWTVHAVAAVSSVFVILYFVRSQWNRNDGGRPLMIMAVAFAAYVDRTVIGYWFPLADTPYRRFLDLTIYFAVLGGWLYLLITMLRAQRRASRERKNDHSELVLRRPFPWWLIIFAATVGGAFLIIWGLLHN